MNELTILERLVYERRRVKAVVEALLAVMEQRAGGNAAYLPFYLTVGQYVEAAIYRLHVQGVRMVEMIRSKPGEPDAATGKVLLDVEQVLADNQRHLADLTRARERLDHEGAAALGAFELVSWGFTRFLTGNIDHHKQIWQLAQKVFSVDDWAYVAGITEEEIQRERILYDRVLSVMPPGPHTASLSSHFDMAFAPRTYGNGGELSDNAALRNRPPEDGQTDHLRQIQVSVTNDFSLHERLACERSRIRAVSEALLVGMQEGSDGNPAYVPFYLALGQYLEFAMQRLHIQSVRVQEMLHKAVDEPDAAVSEAAHVFDRCLVSNQRFLADLRRAGERLEQEGPAALEFFEQVVLEFSAYLLANVGQHPMINDLARRVLDLNHWAYVAGINDEEMQREQFLYERMLALRPPGLQLPGLT